MNFRSYNVILQILIEEEEEVEEEQEDYFKGMAEFVASEENDLEGLYDLLQVNLEYQDFINRLLAAIQEKIEHSTQQQVIQTILWGGGVYELGGMSGGGGTYP